ncbi:competence/damage-inducible protein A [Sporomusa acidovorans]|uniref:Putative competence-damage inducible protein n=1 Tax=Sporomusa acidovorans (strain ATCC 49682 / DSM 3132 / Mol) TaxID=1123286 RepID=A0ABZ3J3I6_SPOA4|nr:competence/damage-inducible protein A [Sporomusa acidovorans]OZC20140.1 putative competence-damage inducible protein [Sporomusa acidovorans DSM 3132]SDD43976.1 nicotinamide-nucleotide amidase [Sporomusa acidovorans]
MIVELVSTGTELLLGQIVNTNAPFLAGRLNELGFSVLFQTTVGDNRDRMRKVLEIAMARADIIITSGGLGPTQGDITKEVTASLLNKAMFLHEESVAHIQRFFDERRLCMSDNNLRQAMMPEGAQVIENTCGTAPGVIIEETTAGKVIINLPGPPHELTAMFEKSIVPYLVERFGIQGVIMSRVLRTYGLGESLLEEKIKKYILTQANPTLALLARNGEIHVRITARAASEKEALQLINELEGKIRPLLEEYIFGIDDETMEQAVGNLLLKQNMTIALAESCTGGLVTSRITDIPGSSGYLAGSFVCYSNNIKISQVGVPEEIIAAKGAVSRETAEYMAEGVRKEIHTDIGVGITGIAGPGGATANKPVGLVYIAVDGSAGKVCYEHYFNGTRTNIKHRTALAALNHVRHYLLTI